MTVYLAPLVVVEDDLGEVGGRSRVCPATRMFKGLEGGLGFSV